MTASAKARVDAIAPALRGVPSGTAQDADLAAQAERAFVTTSATTTPVSLDTLEALAGRVRAAEAQVAGGDWSLPDAPEALPEDPYDGVPGPVDDGFPEHTCPAGRADCCTCSPNRTHACGLEAPDA